MKVRSGRIKKTNKKKTPEKFNDDVLSENYDVIVIFPTYSQFKATQKQDSGRIVCKCYVFINSNVLSYKN